MGLEGKVHISHEVRELRGLEDRISLYDSIYQLVAVADRAVLEPQAYLVLP